MTTFSHLWKEEGTGGKVLASLIVLVACVSIVLVAVLGYLLLNHLRKMVALKRIERNMKREIRKIMHEASVMRMEDM